MIGQLEGRGCRCIGSDADVHEGWVGGGVVTSGAELDVALA